MASQDSDIEARQQGAIETAQAASQDPQSHIRPETVEKKLVDETRKAGFPAYQFDPDASPEDKAAAAESVRGLFILHLSCESSLTRRVQQRVPPGFHHDREPKAVGVVTDKAS